MMRAFIAILSCTFLIVSAHAQTITVAAAADLRPALDEIASRFQRQSGAKVNAIYGSSGNFSQQIQNGAPFDLFFSANVEYPRKLENAGLTVPGSYYEYARGKIVLLVPMTSKLDLKQGLKALLDPAIKKVAIAEPSHAPYGQATVAALKAENIYDQVSTKLVTGENISQAASFVLSGAADAGIVALSLALSPSIKDQVRFAEIPGSDYPPIQQACVVLKSSKQQKLALEFESFVKSEEATQILRRYGFEVPAAVKANNKGKPVP